MLILANSEGHIGIEAARAVLESGGSALDAVEVGVRAAESDETVDSVGRGGLPNLWGEVECDAAVMDGDTLQTGAVGALKGHLHAVTIARLVMERLPHVLLVGEGAARFAEEAGVKPEPSMLTPRARAAWERALARIAPGATPENIRTAPLIASVWQTARQLASGGTVTYLVMDEREGMAGGVSSSGWPFKYPGRLGDSAAIGAGLYVDRRYGGCACTYTGEMTVRTGAARSVVLYMKRGATVEEACREAIADLRDLRGGHLAPVIVHGISAAGESFVASTHRLREKFFYCLWRPGAEPQRCEPVIL